MRFVVYLETVVIPIKQYSFFYSSESSDSDFRTVFVSS